MATTIIRSQICKKLINYLQIHEGRGLWRHVSDVNIKRHNFSTCQSSQLINILVDVGDIGNQSCFQRTSRVKRDCVKNLSVASGRCYVTGHTIQSCWKCQRNIDAQKEQFFCDCGVIQPPTEDRTYFEILGINTTFDIDIPTMTRRFRQLQQLLHPDKFTQKSNIEAEYSDMQSALVNKAYSTLLKPLSRGLYMLELCGDSLEEGETQVEPVFLMEIMEVNEALSEANSMETVERIGNENRIILDGLITQLSDNFKAKNCALAKETLIRLKYYVNIDEKVKELRNKNAGH